MNSLQSYSHKYQEKPSLQKLSEIEIPANTGGCTTVFTESFN